MSLYHGMTGSELPTPADLTADEVSRLLDPEAKDVPELRPNTWLADEMTRLQAIIDGDDDRARGLALADLSMRIVNPNCVEAQELAAAAVEVGEKLGDRRILAAGHCTLGWAIFNRDLSQWRAAADHAVEAECLFHDLRIPEWEAHAMILRMAVAQPSGTDSLITGLEPSISSLLRECTGDRDEYIWLFGLARFSLATTYFAHDLATNPERLVVLEDGVLVGLVGLEGIRRHGARHPARNRGRRSRGDPGPARVRPRSRRAERDGGDRRDRRRRLRAHRAEEDHLRGLFQLRLYTLPGRRHRPAGGDR